MQIKSLNEYRITHKNGSVEEINASSLIEAMENLSIPEGTSIVVQTALAKEGVRTLAEELPAEIPFTTAVTGGSGSIATPASGTVHVGDTLTFQAIPADNYEFVSWKRNDEVISTDATFVYTMTALADGDTSAVFTATFALADVAWTSTVTPSAASSAGCVAFPTSGTIEANGTLGLIAVEATGYTFDHWERNGESVGTSKILSTTVTPLADGETSCVYTAVFTASE